MTNYVALVCFDDFSRSDVFRPRLSTVAQPTYALGRRAAELLMSRIANPTVAPERARLPGRPIGRDSCGARSDQTTANTIGPAIRSRFQDVAR